MPVFIIKMVACRVLCIDLKKEARDEYLGSR